MRVPATRGLCRTFSVAACFSMMTSPAAADEFLWISGIPRSWDEPASWLNLDDGRMGVPGESDDGLFSIAGGTNLHFANFETPGVRMLKSLQVQDGILRLLPTTDVGPVSLVLGSFDPGNPSFVVGGLEVAQLSIVNPAITAPFSIEAVHGVIGAAGIGDVSILGPSVTLDFSGTLDIGGVGQKPGQGGAGTVVLGSGLIRSNWIRQGFSRPGSVTINGPDAQLDVPIRWSIGFDGPGSAILRNGAHATVGDLALGTRPGSSGLLIVEETATLTVDGSIDIGVFGGGGLNIENADLVSIGGSLAIGVGRQNDIWGFPLAIGAGALSITGDSPSCLQIGGDLAVGLAGDGILQTRSIHSVDVAGDLISATNEGVIAIELDAPANSPNAVVDIGGFIDPITVDVTGASNSYAPAPGDTFVLVKALSVTPLQAITLETYSLEEPFRFLRQDTDGELRLRVVNRGDVDGDGFVDFTDLAALLAAWGVCEECPADLDGDGIVGTSDLIILLNNWGS